MSLQALAQEKFWANKAECEDAEKAYYMRLSGAKTAAVSQAGKDEDDFDLFASDEEPAAPAPSKPAPKAAKADKKNKAKEQDQVDGIAAMAGGADPNLMKKLSNLEVENKNLRKVTEDLKNLVIKLEGRVAALEGKGGSSAPAPKAAAKKEEPEEDDDVDLFGSGSESEDDEEKARVREERLAAYHAKKANKPKVIAKTSVVLDIKPWDDETDMDAMLKNVKTITKEGLVWGASKLVPVGYGINKLRVMCVVEDEKVSIDELCEQISEFEDFVQSVDIDAMQKI